MDKILLEDGIGPVPCAFVLTALNVWVLL